MDGCCCQSQIGAFISLIKRIAIYQLLIKFCGQACFVVGLSSPSFHPSMYVYVCGAFLHLNSNATSLTIIRTDLKTVCRHPSTVQALPVVWSQSLGQDSVVTIVTVWQCMRVGLGMPEFDPRPTRPTPEGSVRALLSPLLFTVSPSFSLLWTGRRYCK